MSGALLHPYLRDELAAGRALADDFLRRIARREPIEMDALCQQLGIARMASLERQRGFASRLQEALIEGARDAS